MDNTMNFSAMTRFCHNILKTYQTQNNKTGSAYGADNASFHDKLVEQSTDGKSGKSEGISDTRSMNGILVEDMSMEEYKSYIYDRIESLPVDSSNMQDSVSVHISDEGFEAMKNDPEYEKWVLDTLKFNFQNPDPWSGVSGGKFVIFHFGATKEECRTEIWRLGFRSGNGYRQFNEKSEDSFWERRAKRRKQLKEELDKMQEKKAIAKQMAKSQYFAELAAVKQTENETGKKIGEPINPDMLAMQIFSSFKTNIILESLRGKKAD